MSEYVVDTNTLSVGADETKKVLTFVIALAKAVKESEADGKLTLTDLANFLPIVLSVGPALAGLKEMEIFLKVANEQEAQEIKDWVKTQVPGITEDQHVDQFITSAFAVVLDLWIVIRDFFNLGMPNVTENPTGTAVVGGQTSPDTLPQAGSVFPE